MPTFRIAEISRTRAACMAHDRIHAREPTHHRDRWTRGEIEALNERDGHAIFTVTTTHGDQIELRVTLAVRDLVLSRLEGEHPVGESVWFRARGT